MADELQVTITVKYEKSGTKVAETLTKSVTVAGTKLLHARQSIGTTQEAIDLADAMTVGGYLLVINRDTANFVEIRQATAAADFCKLKAGEPALLRMAADMTAPFAIADTAAVEIEFWLFAD